MRKSILFLILALLLISAVAYAQPNYAVVTTSATYTAVDTDDGLLCGVYVVRASTTAAGTVSIRATTTGTVIVPDIIITADANAGKTGYSAVDPVFVPAVAIQYNAGLKVQTGSADLDVLILYYPRKK